MLQTCEIIYNLNLNNHRRQTIIIRRSTLTFPAISNNNVLSNCYANLGRDDDTVNHELSLMEACRCMYKLGLLYL